MTPIKYFLLVGTAIYVVDQADRSNLVAVAPTTQMAEWLITSLSTYHDKPAMQPDNDDPGQPELPVEEEATA